MPRRGQPFFPCLLVAWGALAGPSSSLAADCPMWAGQPNRNLVSTETNLPSQWNASDRKSLKWSAALGSQTFANPVIAGGKVFIGTNNDGKRNETVPGDRGVLLCFAEADGTFLWQAHHEKRPTGQAHDWPGVGVCSGPCAVGDRLYYVSNRCELVCLDTEGFRDGQNDGPVTDEPSTGQTDADTVWKLDLFDRLKVRPHHACASSPLVVDDLVFVNTGNGFDNEVEKVPAPEAPSFLAVNRNTGAVVWSSNAPGENIIDGQWSSPAYGVINGRAQVIFAGGDGRLYGFEPKSGKPIWTFDCRRGQDENENTLLATPVVYKDKVLIALGQDPENGDGPGGLLAIDATGSGDVTGSALVWKIGGEGFGRSLSTVAVIGDRLYAAEVAGFLHCLDAATGKPHWRHDLLSSVWGSPLVADGKVYVCTTDGDVFVFRDGKDKKLVATNAMNEALYSTPVAANETLYIAGNSRLYALASGNGTDRGVVATRRARSGPASEDWPMFRGDPRLTGVAAGPLPEKLEVLWRFVAPDAIESTAAIVGDEVYVGCYDGNLYALDLATGKQRWKYDAKTPIRSSPGVLGTGIFFGDEYGVFHAVDRDTHKQRWTFTTEAEIISSANFAGDRVFFGSYDAVLYCLSVADGKPLWKFETDGRVHGTPGVAGENVLVAGCDEQLHVVRLADGRNVGAIHMGSVSGASAAIAGPHVYVGTYDGQVVDINWKTNRIEWVYENRERPFPFYGSAAVTDDLVVIGGRDKLVHAIDRKTGKARWTFMTRGRVDGSPVIVADRVFVGSLDGRLYAFDMATGKVRWTFDTGSAILASPAVARGRLVVGAEDGVVYCFGQNDAGGKKTNAPGRGPKPGAATP